MSVEDLQGKQDQQRKTSRDLLLILLLLLLGICMMCLAGQAAIKLAPTWSLEADMGSGLDPNVDYALKSNPEYIEPILPGILDGPDWLNVFLTPGAVIPKTDEQQPVVVPPTEKPPSTQETTQNTTVPEENMQPTEHPTSVVIVLPTQPPNPKPTKPPNPPGPPPDVKVNLKVTNSNGQSTYLAGSTVIYSIIVTNTSANDIAGTIIQDNIPTQIVSWNWVCKSVNNASGCDGITGSSSNFSDTVNIQAGGSIQYEVTAIIKGSATGDLVNIVTITIPSGYADTDLSDNSATDTDTQFVGLLSADLGITKTNGSGTYTPGAGITYTIEVTNYGPNLASGFNITDTIPVEITGLVANCVASGSVNDSCGTNASAGQSVTFNGASLSASQKLTITVSGTVDSSATGSLSNTADIVIPGGASFTDPNSSPGNNSATDTDLPAFSADLSITKTDNVISYTPGDTLTYKIVVLNAGPSDASGATVTDTFPANISSATWTCVATGGASCTASGTGNISDTVNLPVGGSLTYVVDASVSGSGNLVNTATVNAPAGYTDNNSGNDSATDTDVDSTATPTCDTLQVVSNPQTVSINKDSVTCLQFNFSNGATLSMVGHPNISVWWYGLGAGGAGSCGPKEYTFTSASETLNGIDVYNGSGGVILYVIATGNANIDITSIASWDGSGCP